MILKTELGEYAVHFRHVKQINTVNLPFTKYHWVTTASVHPAPCDSNSRPCGSKCLVGVAQCNPVDQFSRATGRKLALTRALQTLNKYTRTQIWKAYLDRGKQ